MSAPRGPRRPPRAPPAPGKRPGIAGPGNLEPGAPLAGHKPVCSLPRFPFKFVSSAPAMTVIPHRIPGAERKEPRVL
jgi:hypothetical protein